MSYFGISKVQRDTFFIGLCRTENNTRQDYLEHLAQKIVLLELKQTFWFMLIFAMPKTSIKSNIH